MFTVIQNVSHPPVNPKNGFLVVEAVMVIDEVSMMNDMVSGIELNRSKSCSR